MDFRFGNIRAGLFIAAVHGEHIQTDYKSTQAVFYGYRSLRLPLQVAGRCYAGAVCYERLFL